MKMGRKRSRDLRASTPIDLYHTQLNKIIHKTTSSIQYQQFFYISIIINSSFPHRWISSAPLSCSLLYGNLYCISTFLVFKVQVQVLV